MLPAPPPASARQTGPEPGPEPSPETGLGSAGNPDGNPEQRRAREPGPTSPDADTAYYARILRELTELGTDLARKVHAEAAAPLAPGAPPDPERLARAADSFDRVARAIRRNIALADHLATPRATAPAEPARPAARTPPPAQGQTQGHTQGHIQRQTPRQPASSLPPPSPALVRFQARQQIIRDVEDAIARRSCTRETDTRDLYAELHENLDDPALDTDLQTRPLADIVTDLCRDLGLGRQGVWKRRTPADIAALRARAAAPPAAPPAALPETLAATLDSTRPDTASAIPPPENPVPPGPHPTPAPATAPLPFKRE